MGQIENEEQDGRFKNNCINNKIECKWSKYPDRKVEMIRLDKKKNKARLNCIRNMKKAYQLYLLDFLIIWLFSFKYG